MKFKIILYIILFNSFLFAQYTSEHTGEHIDSMISKIEDITAGEVTQPFDTLEVTNDASIGGDLDVDGEIKSPTIDALKIEYITVALEAPSNDIVLFKVPSYESYLVDTVLTYFTSPRTDLDSVTFNVFFGDTLYITDDTLFTSNKIITTEETIVSFNESTIPANNFAWVVIQDATDFVATFIATLKTRRQ